MSYFFQHPYELDNDSLKQDLFPEESQQMYEEAYQKTQQEIREQNIRELNKLVQ